MLNNLKRLLITTPKAVFEIVRYKGVFGTTKAIINNIVSGQFLSKISTYLTRHDDQLQLTKEYQDWRNQCVLSDTELEQLKVMSNQLERKILISVLMPVYNTKREHLKEAIDSVVNQAYPNWELCITDDASTMPHVREVLESYSAHDSRIKVSHQKSNQNISAASNTSLEMATGDFIALLDHDDWIEPHALFCIAKTVADNPKADFIYSDEDKVDESGHHIDPFFKPGWSPDYLNSCMYTCHLTAYRRQKVIDVGGFRTEYDFAQDYDLALRMSQVANEIIHIPEVLYHWRILIGSTAMDHDQKPIAHEQAQKALSEHLKRERLAGKVEQGAYSGVHRMRYSIEKNPLVSIVIPTASGTMSFSGVKKFLLQHCCESILNQSSYKNFEIVVIDNNDMPDELAAYCQSQPSIKLFHYTDKFNLAKKINMGVEKSTGEFVILLNDDTEIINSDWIECLLEYAQLPNMGAVGAKLHFADGRIQHAGVAVTNGQPGHLFYLHPKNSLGYFNSNVCVRNYIAVTGACLMVRKTTYQQVGGFSEEFGLNYNDLDFCLKLLETGRRNCMNPYARLYHFESMTKLGTYDSELELFNSKWNKKYPEDPYYNINFEYKNFDFRLGKKPSPLKQELAKH